MSQPPLFHRHQSLGLLGRPFFFYQQTKRSMIPLTTAHSSISFIFFHYSIFSRLLFCLSEKPFSVSNLVLGRESPAANYVMNTAEFQIEPHKLVSVLLFLIVAAFSNWIALAYVHDFIGRTALPDIVFHFIDEQPWATPVGDFMVTLSAISLILLFVFHKHRVVILRRMLFIIGCLYTFRTIMMLITQLPSGYKNNDKMCRPALNASELTFTVYLLRTLEQAIHVGFQDNSRHMLCGDLLFSGHTLIMIVSTLACSRYMDKSFEFLKWPPLIFALIGVPCMIISRTHYTCDVIIAYLASKAIFTLYHAFCEIESSVERKRSILTRTLFIIKIASWLEENVDNCKLKNEFEIPLLDVLEKFMDLPNRRDGNKSMSNSSSTAAIESV